MKLISSGLFLQNRVKRGDLKAFETLFREYYNPLSNFALGYVNDPDTAEEIVQDFFYHFWKNKENINVTGSLKAYLFSAVKNFCLKHIEKQSVRRRYAERILTETADEEKISFQPELEAKELKKEIDKVLESLPERSREIFRLSRFEGLKYREIADKLSVSVKTVEADMTRTLKILRERISAYEKAPQTKN